MKLLQNQPGSSNIYVEKRINNKKMNFFNQIDRIIDWQPFERKRYKIIKRSPKMP